MEESVLLKVSSPIKNRSPPSRQQRLSPSPDALLVADVPSQLPTDSCKLSASLPVSSMKFSQSRKWVSNLRKEIKFINQGDSPEQNDDQIVAHAKTLVYRSPQPVTTTGRESPLRERPSSPRGVQKNWDRAVRWAHDEADKKIQRARRGRSNSLKTRFLRTEQRLEQVVAPQRFKRMHLLPSHSAVVRQKIMGKMQEDSKAQALSKIPQQNDEFITTSVIGDSQIIQVVIGMAPTESYTVISEEEEPLSPIEAGIILRTNSKE